MSISSKSRVIFLLSACFLSLVGLIMLAVCIFSSDYRWVGDHEVMKGVRSYGLIRYCFKPEHESHQSDDSNTLVCYLRTRGPIDERPVNFKQHYGSFEMTTLVLLSGAIAAALAGICFAICTIFTKFGAFAHSIALLVAAICSLSGFIVYTYFNELMDNQTEKISGNLFRYHYGWAYYLTGLACLVLLIAFVCSLLGSAFVLVHSNRKNRDKVESIAL